MLYVNLQKALYGLLVSALLLYRKLVTYLEKYMFKINPYYPFLVNKILKGHQITVTWHVELLKVSHKDCFEINSFAHYLPHIYVEI